MIYFFLPITAYKESKKQEVKPNVDQIDKESKCVEKIEKNRHNDLGRELVRNYWPRK